MDVDVPVDVILSPVEVSITLTEVTTKNSSITKVRQKLVKNNQIPKKINVSHLNTGLPYLVKASL